MNTYIYKIISITFLSMNLTINSMNNYSQDNPNKITNNGKIIAFFKKAYVLKGRINNKEKKFETQRTNFFLCTTIIMKLSRFLLLLPQ